MKNKEMAERVKGNNYFGEMLKALIVALLISLVMVLLAALVIKIFNISTATIPIINQVIKGLSILIAALVCFKLKNNGWLRGIILGILYIMLSYVVFSLLDGEFKLGLSLLNDVVLGMITGLISGIISVNIKK